MQTEANITDADRAYERIKQMIVTLKLKPGAVIQEQQLINQLSLGRTPIREALNRLEVENLVIIEPRRGIFVADIAITDLTQIYEVRKELEALAACLATARADAADIARLELLVEEYRTIDPADLEALFAIDREFHMTLAHATNNSFLIRELDLFYNLSLRIWYLALSSVSASDIDVEAHLEILIAIQHRNPQMAEERMREHIRCFHQAIRQYI
jgi:DNA-binding GntR family transcriptional regulator